MNKLKQMSRQDADRVLAELEEMANRMAQVGNILGPVLGAAWCDKALKLERRIFAFKVMVDDAVSVRGIRP